MTGVQTCALPIYTEAAESILQLLEMDRQQIIYECKQSIKRFDLDTYIHRIEKLFDEVI